MKMNRFASAALWIRRRDVYSEHITPSEQVIGWVLAILTLGTILCFAAAGAGAQSAPLTLMGHTLGEGKPLIPAMTRSDCIYAAIKASVDADTSKCPAFDVNLTFEEGKLVKFGALAHMRLFNAAVEKLGKPTAQDTLPLQNGFGATWTDRLYVWALPGGYVTLYEDNGPDSGASGLSNIVVMTPGQHAKEVEELNRLKRNPL